MVRNFSIAIFWIAMISIFLMVAPKANQQRGFTSRRTDLVGQVLYDETHGRVGTVTDVVVDVEAGEVEYLIARMEFTDALPSRSGAASDTLYVVVPWQNVLRQRVTNGFTLTVEQTKVQNAPHLTTLPDTTQAGWDTGLGEAWQ